jgi:hypothetical protein
MDANVGAIAPPSSKNGTPPALISCEQIHYKNLLGKSSINNFRKRHITLYGQAPLPSLAGN